MPRALAKLLAVFRAALLVGAAGGALLLAAIVVASARFDACGASRLDAVDAHCRLGLQLLLAAYCVLAVALVLGAASLTLLWRLRRRLRRDADAKRQPLS